jgi:gamma-tubulin complex component 3
MQVEVLESAWKTFTDDVNEAENLDQIRGIQVKFIENILEKSLLSPSRNEIYKQITKIFEMIHKFKFTQDVLYTAAHEELQRRQ